MLTLRCPKKPTDQYKVGAHAGYILIAEPIGKETTINDHRGQSMFVRPASFYENIFKDLYLGVVHFEDFPEYSADDTHDIHAERVWLLQEKITSPHFDPTQMNLLQLFQNNLNY